MLGGEPRRRDRLGRREAELEMASSSCSVTWSCRSPPATLIASTGLPSLSTSVGVSVMRGRLPGSMQLGCPRQVLRLRRRLPSTTPVVAGQHAAPAAGRGGDHVALAVGDHAGGRVADGSAGSRYVLRRLPRSALPARGSPGRSSSEARLQVDQRPAQIGVSRRKKLRQRHVDEQRVAVVGVAVGQASFIASTTRGRSRAGCGPWPCRSNFSSSRRVCSRYGPWVHGPHLQTVWPRYSIATGSSMRVTCVARSG